MSLISIIVPFYNSEKFLPQCIESLLAQTLIDIEIILINDGSCDSSLKICEQYAENDHRIIIISKSNEGLAKARRDGIKKANSEFISFLDSDDYYEPMFCEKMYDYMVKLDADLVECDYYLSYVNWKKKHELFDSDKDFTQELFRNYIVRKSIVNGTEAVVVWNKLYRKCFIDRLVLEFGNSPLEDYIFNVQYYTNVNRYAYIHQSLTNYRQLPISLSRTCNLQTYEILKATETIKDDCLEKMGMITDVDKKDDAEWYVNYTINFMKQYLLTNNCHSDAFMHNIFMDEMLIQKCALIAQQNKLAGLIANSNIKSAIRQIKYESKLYIIKKWLANMKHMVIQKR